MVVTGLFSFGGGGSEWTRLSFGWTSRVPVHAGAGVDLRPLGVHAPGAGDSFQTHQFIGRSICSIVDGHSRVPSRSSAMVRRIHSSSALRMACAYSSSMAKSRG